MIQSPSLFELSKERSTKVIKFVSHNTSQLLKSSRGRDKILAMIQYWAELYKECMKDYLSSRRIREWPFSVRNSDIVNKNIRTGRKLFRLFRWLEEIPRMMSDKPGALSALKSLKHLFSAIYYILDNVVWLTKIGVMSRFISDEQWGWEMGKNYISIIKYIFVILLIVFSAGKNILKEHSLKKKLMEKAVIKMGTPEYETMLKYLKIRAQRRFQALEGIRVLFRLVIVHKNLRLPGHELMSPAFSSVCGLLSAFLSIFKILIVKNKHLLEAKAQENSN